MSGPFQSLVVDTVTTATPEQVDLGFKPHVMFAMGAGLNGTGPQWGAPAYAGFGWSPDPALGGQGSVGSGGYGAGHVWGGCTISASLYTAEFEATNLQARVIETVAYNCDTIEPHTFSGYTTTKSVVMFNQKMATLALGGDNISVETGDFHWPGAAGDVVVTGLGFEPQLVMFVWAKQSAYNQGYPNGAGSGFGFGAASSASAGNQFCHYSSSEYFGPNYGNSCHMEGKVIQCADAVGLINGAVLTAIGSDGFTVSFSGNDTEPSSVPGRLIAWIALRDEEGGFHVGLENAETSTGTRSYSGCGFTPDQVITHHGNALAANTNYNFTGAYGFGIFDDAVQLSIMNGETLGSFPGGSARYMNDGKCVSMTAISETVTAEAEFVSMDGDGFTLDWTLADGNAFPFGYIAMKTTGENFGGNCGGASPFRPQIYRWLKR